MEGYTDRECSVIYVVKRFPGTVFWEKLPLVRSSDV